MQVTSNPHHIFERLLAATLIVALPSPSSGQDKVPIPAFKMEGEEQLLFASDAPHWNNGIDCGSCHVAHQSPAAQLTSVEGNANLCMSCHNPAGVASDKPFSNAHRAVPGVSGTSHAWEVPANNATRGASAPTDSAVAKRVYEGQIVCSTCHNQHKQTYPPFLRASNYQNALCKDCHAVRNVGTYQESPDNKGSHPVGISYPYADSRFHSSHQNPDLPLVDSDRVECTTCHGVHYADSGGANGDTGDGYILRVANNNALCEACHTYPGHMGMGCDKCHQPHDPDRTNILLVKGAVATPNSGDRSVLFLSQSGNNSFADGDPVYRGICEVCHTSTAYHRNYSGGDHEHMTAMNCTTCHPHQDGFLPPSCLDCHSAPQDNGDGVPVGGRRAIAAEFDENSHHVHGSSIERADCRTCHEMSRHMQGRVRILDRDDAQTVYELTNRPTEDAAEAAKLVPFCLNCHDGDDDAPFSDGKTPPVVDAGLWEDAAHNHGGDAGMPLRCLGDGQSFGCHATGHGSPNVKLLSAAAGVSLDAFCFNCHTDGKLTNIAISGSGLADDMEQAFGLARMHDLGTSFTVGGKEFTLQCTTCHNPHIVTGKHWDVASGVSPITRPDLSADPTSNPRAMGSALWGAAAGQKMDDFAARGSGTGGWKFSAYRGIEFGATDIPADQPAVYQPPKKGSGYNFEFDGNVLPDYATFCLDCHTNRVGTHPPVNWGQGISCTDNSVDPPEQRVECGAQHGLAPANVPNYSNDPGWWGNNGNPDPILSEPGATRGRGYGHFMRWPYESADRNAGINFVMSCTDCHEAHGSNIGSMLRTNPNNGSGSTTWNTMCNSCHYYYGGQHADMSCGSASCHEANSVHRIIHVTHSIGKYLWTPPGIPEITQVDGASGSDLLAVTFSEGVFSNPDQTGGLTPADFELADSDDGRTITSVSHTAWSSTAELTLSSPLDVSNDIRVDELSAASASIFDNVGIPMQTDAVIISGIVCPEGMVTFSLNEPAGSATVEDDQGVHVGTVGNPSFALPGDGYFHGDENQGTYIDFDNSAACLMSPRALTIEARVKPTAVDLDWEDTDGDGKDDILDRDATFSRIFERQRNIKTTILHTWYRGDTTAVRDDKASIEVKYFVASGSRHSCPDPQWPDDPYEGSDSRWHQISTDIDQWPIVNNHWYQIKVVFNSGNSGAPVDIFVDDQGPNGDDAGEKWTGYVNASQSINESSSCRWGALPGDYIATEDQISYIGAPPNHDSAYLFKGLIDWITWQPVAD